MSLMKANNATHVVILSHDPVDLLVLAVPVISADPATETALALVRRLLALTPEAGVRRMSKCDYAACYRTHRTVFMTGAADVEASRCARRPSA